MIFLSVSQWVNEGKLASRTQTSKYQDCCQLPGNYFTFSLPLSLSRDILISSCYSALSLSPGSLCALRLIIINHNNNLSLCSVGSSSEPGNTKSDKLFLLFCQPEHGLLGRLIKVLDAQRGGLSSLISSLTCWIQFNFARPDQTYLVKCNFHKFFFTPSQYIAFCHQSILEFCFKSYKS